MYQKYKINLTEKQIEIVKTQANDVEEYLQMIINDRLVHIERNFLFKYFNDMSMKEKKVKLGIDLREFEIKEKAEI